MPFPLFDSAYFALFVAKILKLNSPLVLCRCQLGGYSNVGMIVTKEPHRKVVSVDLILGQSGQRGGGMEGGTLNTEEIIINDNIEQHIRLINEENN